MSSLRGLKREYARRAMKKSGHNRLNRLYMANGKTLFANFWKEYVPTKKKR